MDITRSLSPLRPRRAAPWLTIAAATLLVTAAPVFAQANVRAAPNDVRLAAPPRLTYTSAFNLRLSHVDAQPIDWAQSNALMGRLQGHAGHLRGTPAAEANPPAAHGHHGAMEPKR
jgi:hypothetical protein